MHSEKDAEIIFLTDNGVVVPTGGGGVLDYGVGGRMKNGLRRRHSLCQLAYLSISGREGKI